MPSQIRQERLTRYILPLREGGSLPGLAEAEDGFRYAVKFKGAGHGVKSLIAEFLGGLIAKALKLRVPELVLLDLDPMFGTTEPDFEVQQLLRKSEGLNLGLHFLDRAMAFEPSVNNVEALEASKILWFDSFIQNIDRTRQNTNMLMWNNELWLIDHGSSFYFHHADKEAEEAATSKFEYIKDHVLLPYASKIEEADKLMRQAITPRTLDKIVELIPEAWLIAEEYGGKSPREIRDYYKKYLNLRLKSSSVFVDQAKNEYNKRRP